MKKLTLLSAGAMIALGAIQAQAQVVVNPPSIGVQFTPYYSSEYNVLNESGANGNPNPDGFQAGVINQQFWNVANNTVGAGTGTDPGTLDNTSLVHETYISTGPAITPATGLVDSNGNTVGTALTGIGFQLTNATNNDHTAAGGPFPSVSTAFANGQPAAEYLVTGVQATNDASNPVTLALTGLNSGDYYDLYAYVGSLWYYGSTNASVNLGSTTFDLKTDGGTLSNYTISTATSATGAPVADYVEFTNVLGSTLNSDNLTVTGAGTGLSGFQLQDIGSSPAAAPEPSTVWMFSLGFLGLMVHVYRKRQARS